MMANNQNQKPSVKNLEEVIFQGTVDNTKYSLKDDIVNTLKGVGAGAVLGIAGGGSVGIGINEGLQGRYTSRVVKKLVELKEDNEYNETKKLKDEIKQKLDNINQQCKNKVQKLQENNIKAKQTIVLNGQAFDTDIYTSNYIRYANEIRKAQNSGDKYPVAVEYINVDKNNLQEACDTKDIHFTAHNFTRTPCKSDEEEIMGNACAKQTTFGKNSEEYEQMGEKKESLIREDNGSDVKKEIQKLDKLYQEYSSLKEEYDKVSKKLEEIIIKYGLEGVKDVEDIMQNVGLFNNTMQIENNTTNNNTQKELVYETVKQGYKPNIGVIASIPAVSTVAFATAGGVNRHKLYIKSLVTEPTLIKDNNGKDVVVLSLENKKFDVKNESELAGKNYLKIDVENNKISIIGNNDKVVKLKQLLSMNTETNDIDIKNNNYHLLSSALLSFVPHKKCCGKTKQNENDLYKTYQYLKNISKNKNNIIINNDKSKSQKKSKKNKDNLQITVDINNNDSNRTMVLKNNKNKNADFSGINKDKTQSIEFALGGVNK